jgi:hypothetical protein
MKTNEGAAGHGAARGGAQGTRSRGNADTNTAVLERPRDRRLSLNLASSVYDELSALADDRRTSMTEIVRLALGVIRVIIKEVKQNHKIIVADQDGNALKELVLPE